MKLNISAELFLAFLTLIFAAAKVFGPAADWSWWTVFCPILIPVGIGLAFVICAALYAGYTEVKAKKMMRERRESFLGRHNK